MDILGIQDIQFEILKYLNLEYLLNLLLVNTGFNPLYKSEKYIQSQQFYQKFQNDYLGLKPIYEIYLEQACLQGNKFVVEYLLDKYNFNHKHQQIQDWILLSENLDCCHWYFSNYPENNLDSLSRYNPVILEFILQKFPKYTKTIFVGVFIEAIRGFNLEFIKWFLKIYKPADILYYIQNYLDFGHRGPKLYKLIKYFVQELKLDLKPLIADTNILNKNILQLINPDYKFKPLDIIYIECENIRYGHEPYNLTEKIQLITELLKNIFTTNIPISDMDILFEHIVNTGEKRLISALPDKILVQDIIDNMRFIHTTDEIINFIILKWNIPFKETLWFYNFDYTRYYRKYRPKIKKITGKFKQASHDLLDLIYADNPDIIIDVDYNRWLSLTCWLLKNKFVEWEDINLTDLTWSDVHKTWSFSVILEYLIKYPRPIDINTLGWFFKTSSYYSRDCAKKLLVFKNRLELSENCHIWLDIPANN